jgi:hypothetical protein
MASQIYFWYLPRHSLFSYPFMSVRNTASRFLASTCSSCRRASSYSASQTLLWSTYSSGGPGPRTLASKNNTLRRTSLYSQCTMYHNSRADQSRTLHSVRQYASAAKSTTSSTALRVIPPDQQELKTSEEFEDAELLPIEEANIVVTDDAIKVGDLFAKSFDRVISIPYAHMYIPDSNYRKLPAESPIIQNWH